MCPISGFFHCNNLKNKEKYNEIYKYMYIGGSINYVFKVGFAGPWIIFYSKKNY